MPAASEGPYGEIIPTGPKMLVRLFPYADPSKAKNEWKITTFEKTPPVSCNTEVSQISSCPISDKMSTYLVAFANGDFKYIKDSYKSPLSGKVRELRIYSMFQSTFTAPRAKQSARLFVATPDVIHQAQFALDVKRECLPHYEKAFDVEFPLPKLDTLVVSFSYINRGTCY